MGPVITIDNSTPVLWQLNNSKDIIESKKQVTHDVYSALDFEKSKEYFHVMPHEEPHCYRRRIILEKYPQIKNLYVKDSFSAILTICILIFQLITVSYIQNTSWPVFLAFMYVVGATLDHTLYVLVHDLTHFTAFENLFLNRFFAILANIPTAIPSAMTFQFYHREHHLYLGNPKFDPDLPTMWEIRTFNKPWKKFIFIFFIPLFYAVRPLFTAPKKPEVYEFLNYVIIFASDYLIYTFIGPNALLYLLISGFMSMGMHPMAIHIIAEHYEFVKGLETYNYLGIANIFNLNLGYHIEHHDFPQIPWRLLPRLREIAPEFYEKFPVHYSYLKVAYKYIMDENIGPFSRIDTSDVQVQKKN